MFWMGRGANGPMCLYQTANLGEITCFKEWKLFCPHTITVKNNP